MLELEARIKSLEDALSQTNKRQLALKNLLDTIVPIVNAMQPDQDIIEKGVGSPGLGNNTRFMGAMERVENGLKAMVDGVKSCADLSSNHSESIAWLNGVVEGMDSRIKALDDRLSKPE